MKQRAYPTAAGEAWMVFPCLCGRGSSKHGTRDIDPLDCGKSTGESWSQRMLVKGLLSDDRPIITIYNAM